MDRDYNIKFIRNFSIIAHIDHGKSTLADRFLEITSTIDPRKMRPRFLDLMDLEREKGVTIKMQPVRMHYLLQTTHYALNLIDTPGHVDFSYEVSRSMAAVEGTILLVDAVKGIQAQTLHNLDLARKQNLTIIPAVNKIDLTGAKTDQVLKELAGLLGVEEKSIIKISAKYGTNVKDLLKELIKRVPAPKGKNNEPLKALIFDSRYDSYKGVIAFCRIIDGNISKGEKIFLKAAQKEGVVKEVGFFKPELDPQDQLNAGEIGYIATGIKDLGKVRVGDTITKLSSRDIDPLLGYQKPKPVVFASIYPEDSDDFDSLKGALEKLSLTDPSFTFELESEKALGRGFRCGFLGSFHAEIILERIRREFGLDLILSTPSVVYKIINEKNREFLVFSPSDWKTEGIKEGQEPWVRLEIITPPRFLGQVLAVLENLRGNHIETSHLSGVNVLLVYEVPLSDIITGFYDNLKAQTQGYASMNYEILGFRTGDLIKLDIMIAGREVEAFSRIVPREKAFKEGKLMVKKLKEIFPPQQFAVALQAAISGKVIARETIRARAKNVTASLYGGDYTRKSKLLQKQKKGKKKLKERAQIKIPPRIFLEMFRRK